MNQVRIKIYPIYRPPKPADEYRAVVYNAHDEEIRYHTAPLQCPQEAMEAARSHAEKLDVEIVSTEFVDRRPLLTY